MSAQPTVPDTPTQARSPASTRALDRSLLLGIAWTGGTKWLAQVLSWAATLVVARLLSPADYGLMSMATVYTGFVAPVFDFGLGAAIIQRRGYTREQVAQLGGLAMLFGVGLFALSAAAAGPIARFYGEPPVRPLIIALSVGLLIGMLAMLPRSLLARDLEFRRLAMLDGLWAISQTAVTLTLALVGFGYWALALGVIGAALVTTPAALATRRHPLAWPRDRATVADAVRFGWHIVIARLGWYAYSNADFLIVGRVLGKRPLGLYTLGWTIATIPVDRVSELAAQVTPGVFSAVQDHKAALRRYFLALSEGLALLTLPGAIGLALTADDFVLLVLGEEWREATTPLRILAGYATFRSLATLTAPVLVATGHTRRNMQLTLLAVAVLPALFYVGTRWGTAGVAAGWAVGFPIVALPLFRFVFRLLDLPLRAYLRALWPALSGTTAMAAAVLATRLAVPSSAPLGLRFALAAGAGAATYAGVILAFHAPRLRAAWALFRAPRAP